MGEYEARNSSSSFTGGFEKKRSFGGNGGGFDNNRKPMEQRRGGGFQSFKNKFGGDDDDFPKKDSGFGGGFGSSRGGRGSFGGGRSFSRDDKENEEKSSDEERFGNRASRGGFGGERGAGRGGFRGGFGSDRGGGRGGFGSDRGGSRGGFGSDRGGSRGGFSSDRGGSRGGFSSDRGGGRGGFSSDRGGGRGGFSTERSGGRGGTSFGTRGGSRGGRGGFGDGGRGGFGDGGRDSNRDGGFQSRFSSDDRGGRGGRGGRGSPRGSRGGAGESRFGGGGRSGDKFEERRKFGDRPGPDAGEGDDEKPRENYIPPEPPTAEDEVFSNGLKTGINFSKFDHIPLKVTGDDAPKPIKGFTECGLRDMVLKNVKRSGYKVPTPIQKIALPVVLTGRDLMACAQTGSGKTAAFLVPIINQLVADGAEIAIGKPYALILSPTRELAIQIYTEARKFAYGSFIRSSILYGGTSTRHQFESFIKGCHILIATPGRLIDFVDKDSIKFDNLRYLILDEADRMLNLGFKESIEKIMKHARGGRHTKRQTLMFSATFPKEIQVLAAEYLNNYIFASVGAVGGACTDITQTILEVARLKKRDRLMELLSREAEGVIIFVETKRGTDFIASFLSEKDMPSTSIHGDRLQSQRELALHDFKTGKMKILVATSVAARGLDIKGVKHVINYDLPQAIEDYVHRIGRTGRLGNNGKATSFFDPERDSDVAPDLVKILEGSGQKVPDFLRRYRGGGGGGGRQARGQDNRFGGNDIREEDEEDY